MAKDLSPDEIPSDLTLDGVLVNHSAVADAFASHFNEKVLSNASRTTVNLNGVYAATAATATTAAV